MKGCGRWMAAAKIKPKEIECKYKKHISYAQLNRK